MHCTEHFSFHYPFILKNPLLYRSLPHKTFHFIAGLKQNQLLFTQHFFSQKCPVPHIRAQANRHLRDGMSRARETESPIKCSTAIKLIRDFPIDQLHHIVPRPVSRRQLASLLPTTCVRSRAEVNNGLSTSRSSQPSR